MEIVHEEKTQKDANDTTLNLFIKSLLTYFLNFAALPEVKDDMELKYVLLGDFAYFLNQQKIDDIPYNKINNIFNSFLELDILEIANLICTGFFEGLELDKLFKFKLISTGKTKELLNKYF
jgi:hypothetical protein